MRDGICCSTVNPAGVTTPLRKGRSSHIPLHHVSREEGEGGAGDDIQRVKPGRYDSLLSDYIQFHTLIKADARKGYSG